MSKQLTLPNQVTDIKWTSYLAVGVAEGFEEPDVEKDMISYAEIEAWAVIIKYKLYTGLQGWFGRMAHAILDEDLIQIDGTIEWGILRDRINVETD